MEKEAQPAQPVEIAPSVSEQAPVETVPSVSEQALKGIIRGSITYPYGIVDKAKVFAGETIVLSDQAGNYELSDLVPGSHSVRVKAPFPGYEASPQTVEVKAGEIHVVDFFLDFKKAVVEGHVYSQDGKPIAGATLSGVLSGKEHDSVMTNAEGYFRFDKATPGARFMRVNAPGFLAETRDFNADENQPAALEFHLVPATCKISGTVKDVSGQPLGGQVLLMKAGIVIQKTISDAKTGYYEFPAVPDRYEILPAIPGYHMMNWSGAVEADIKADFTLNPGTVGQESKSLFDSVNYGKYGGSKQD